MKASIEIKFNLRGWSIADGIFAKILSVKGEIRKILVAGKKEPSYLANDGKGNYAHGGTLREAVEELAFKIGDRDVSQYRNMPVDTVKTPQDWAFVYRIITGACQYGTRSFMERHELKPQYTLPEIIEATKSAFGHDTFVGVVRPIEKAGSTTGQG